MSGDDGLGETCFSSSATRRSSSSVLSFSAARCVWHPARRAADAMATTNDDVPKRCMKILLTPAEEATGMPGPPWLRHGPRCVDSVSVGEIGPGRSDPDHQA